MPFHCVMVIVEGSMTICHVFYYLSAMRFMPFHHTLMQMEGNYDNATLLTIVEVELDLCHSTTH